LTTLVVAIAVVLALPVSQLRVVTVQHQCCCPHPESCACPHAPAPVGDNTSASACHHRTTLVVAPTLAGFAMPAPTVLAADEVRIAVVEHALTRPIAAADPRRPDAPS
jgi:hypothetical protein